MFERPLDRSFEQPVMPVQYDEGAYAVLSRYLSVAWYYRRLFLSVFGGVLVLGGATIFSLHQSYMATATVVVTTPVSDPLQESGGGKNGLEEDELATQAALIASRDVAEAVLRQLPPPPAAPKHNWKTFACGHGVHFACEAASSSGSNSASAADRAVDGLLGAITVEPQARSRVISVSAKSESGPRAAALANSFISSYQQLALTRSQNDLRHEADWLDNRTSALRQRWLEAEHAATNFNVRHGLVNTAGDSPLVDKQISDMSSSLNEAQTRYATAEARRTALNAAIRKGDPQALIPVSDQPLLLSVANSLMQAEATRSQKAATFGPNHPDVQALDHQIAGFRAQLRTETHRALTAVNTEAASAKADMDSLMRSMGTLQKQSAGKSGPEAEYRTLRQEAESARSVYEAFLDRSKAIADRVALLQPPVAFVSHAVAPAAPTFPNRKKLLIGVVVLAAVAAAGAVTLRAFLSAGFINPEEVQNFGGLPLLAVLPEVRAGSRKKLSDLMMDAPFSSAAEVVRGLCAQLALAGGHNQGKTEIVAVTSAEPGDGKTMVATWMASAVRMTGQSVLIVDLDYRRLASNKDELSGKKGFSDVLTGRASVRDLILKGQMGGVDVLPPGGPRVTSFDSAEVAQIRDLFRDLSQDYRMIVINVPPLALSFDGLVMASVADQTIFVCRRARTSRSTVAACLEKLRSYGARITGLVLTGGEDASANLLCAPGIRKNTTGLLGHDGQV